LILKLTVCLVNPMTFSICFADTGYSEEHIILRYIALWAEEYTKYYMFF
jgi:hypothetical protein